MAKRRRPRLARTRSIRTTLTGLLLIPLVALVGLWALLATITVGNALAEHREHDVAASLGAATNTLLDGLESEQAQTFIWLSSGQRTLSQALTSSRRVVSAAVATYERLYPRTFAGGSEPSRRSVVLQLDKIAGIRTAVDARTLSATTAFEDFSGIVNGLFSALLTTTVPDVPVQLHTDAAIFMGQALGEFGGELTLSAAAEFDGGRIPAPDVTLFGAAVSAQRLALDDALAEAGPQLHASLERLYNSPLHRSVAALEDQIVASGGHPPIQTLVAWGQQAQAFLKQFEAVAKAAPAPIALEAGQYSNDLFIEAGLAAGLGLVAVVGVVLLMLRFGRRIRTELTGLHDGAQEMASQRLPTIVQRLSEGEDVDVAAASPPLPAGRITEIATVADAFSAVQRTAVDAAVGQASLRKGVSKVFLNLSLRNQSILHRQLGMLDALERATDDPAALADLFRLDHLTTRMRRHAESLIILSGARPGRSWRDPVPVVDVLRAAVAEVEDYTRVDVEAESDAAVVGPAANDVVHLIAELVENATSFSPPNTKVDLRVDAVGTGVAVEIEDRGLGLTALERDAINARLANPPGFDLVATEHLGLFVVGQLAARHSIGVSLRRSAFGGVTAVVVLPHNLMVYGGGGLTEPARLRSLPGVAQSRDHASAAGRFDGNGSNGGWPAASGELAGTVLARGQRGTRGPFEPIRRADPGADLYGQDAGLPGVGQETAGAARTAPNARPWSVQSGTHRGLPQRVRQASLVPQLSNGGAQVSAVPSQHELMVPSRQADAVGGRDGAGQVETEPSPEQILSRMSSLQDGWQRGRSDELYWPGAGRSEVPGQQPDRLDPSDG